MSFPLPPEFERAVLDRVRSGQYASPEDVLAAMLELLEDAEAEYDAKLEELRRDVRVGFDQLDRGEALTSAEVFDLLPVGRGAARGDDAAVAQAMEAIRQRCGIPLGARYRRFVDEEVRSGRYASPAEVLEAALWLLRDAESPESDEALEALRREIAIGLESEKRDPMIPGDEVVARTAARLSSPEVQEFVGRKIEEGEYGSFSEAAAAGLLVLMEEETDWDPEELRRELQIGRDSFARGEGIPADQARQMIMNWREEDAA